MGAQASGKASTVNSASGKAKRLQSANAATDKSQLSTPSIPATSDKKTSGQRKIRPLYKLNDQLRTEFLKKHVDTTFKYCFSLYSHLELNI